MFAARSARAAAPARKFTPVFAASATPQPSLHSLLRSPRRVRQSQNRLHRGAARLRTRAISLANTRAPQATIGRASPGPARPLDVARRPTCAPDRTFASPAPAPAACIRA
ncbi:hypothetical protein PSPO01_02082 [Paraphaeosphaeria sporulosa]